MLVKALKQIIYLGLLLVIVASLYLGFQFNEFRSNAISLPQQSANFMIKPGSSIRQVAQKLADKGYIKDPVMFIALSKIENLETSIKAGEYRIRAEHSPMDLLDLFSKGESILYSFTIIEGWTFRQLLQAVHQDPILVKTLDHDDVTSIMAQISHADEHPEGRFLPDTYHFPRGTTDLAFLKRAYKTMQRKLAAEWKNRSKDLPLKSPYEALILASIIEKETGVASERPIISSVFHNRLKKRMRLASDPTVIYGINDFNGNITKKDLNTYTPYNTYMITGLPPGPIANPGSESIKAALYPAKTDYLYFVAKRDRTHHFSASLAEHNRAVRKYQLRR